MEPILDNGKIRRVYRHRVIGPCAEISKGNARATLQNWLRPLNEGRHTPIESVSFADYHAKWERDLLPTYRESTRQFYQSTAQRWVLPYFTTWLLTDIRPVDIQQFINLFAAKYSRSVLKHVRATLNCLFGTAVDWQYLHENPAVHLKLPEGRAVARASVLTPAQLARVIEQLGEPHRTMAKIAALTSIRESELFALRWDDFANGVLTVRRKIYRGHVGEVKSAKAAREIPLHPVVQAAVGALALTHRHGPYLFLQTDGSGEAALEHRTRVAFTEVATQLGIPRFTWRSFRRSAESAMHRSGVSLKAQQAVMGHSNPNMTLVYAETDEQAKREAVTELGKLIFPTCPKLSIDAIPVATSAVN